MHRWLPVFSMESVCKQVEKLKTDIEGKITLSASLQLECTGFWIEEGNLSQGVWWKNSQDDPPIHVCMYVCKPGTSRHT